MVKYIIKKNKQKGKNKMTQEKKIYYSDLANYVDVCYSCKSQNISIHDIEIDNQKNYCLDCHSEDVGAVPPEDVI